MTLQDYYYLSVLIENAKAENCPMPAYLQSLDEIAKGLGFDSIPNATSRAEDPIIREQALKIYNMYPTRGGSRVVLKEKKYVVSIENLIKKHGYANVEKELSRYIEEAGDYIKNLQGGLTLLTDRLNNPEDEPKRYERKLNKYGRYD